MAKTILVVPTGDGAGLTSVALGLVHALDRRGVPVGFCKPITQLHASDRGPERSTLLVQSFANLTPPEPLPLARAEELLGQGRENELLEEVIARYQEAARDAGIVIVEGLVPLIPRYVAPMVELRKNNLPTLASISPSSRAKSLGQVTRTWLRT